jgi:hypothetical protein
MYHRFFPTSYTTKKNHPTKTRDKKDGDKVEERKGEKKFIMSY